MMRLWKIPAISLMTLMMVAPPGWAKHKTVIYYQSASSPGWYQVYSEPQPTAPPAYTYQVPSSTSQVYVYAVPTVPAGVGEVKIKVPTHDSSIFVDGQFAGSSDHVMKLGLEAGTHNIQVRDRTGNTVFDENVAVSANQETELKARK